ncbi:MAG TPA: hypothetical protein VKY82_07915 [Flavobacterium sp.]|nr:hypothetical protein [Flavobacterium sp.]
MNYSGFTTKLGLAYSPLCNHDFEIIKSEKIVQQILEGAMLYAIGQRSILTFENIVPTEDETALNFEIHLQGTDLKLTCSLPLYQEHIGQDESEGVNVEFGSYDPDWYQKTPPINDVNGIRFYDKDMNFLLWLSPDKFLHHYWNNVISATVVGDIRPFTEFKIHYVGKATDQEVWDRLTGHYSLQKILGLERPNIKGTLPTHEITLLIFRVVDKMEFSILGDDVDTFVDKLVEPKLPDDKTVSLDAEKALVKLLNPEYNHPTKRFPNYPKSTDGLHKFEFDRFAYLIKEDITLVYNDVEIVGASVENKADIIGISNNESMEIIKASDLGTDETTEKE